MLTPSVQRPHTCRHSGHGTTIDPHPILVDDLADLPDFAPRFRQRHRWTGGEGDTRLVTPRDGGPDLVLKILPKGADLAEASILRAVAHPRIPAVLEVGRLADGRPFVLREFAPGVPLAECAPLDPKLAIEIAAQLCEVLAFLHLRSVLHLDLKPGNLVVATSANDEPELAVLDFGFAQRDHAARARGTPFFAAPELILGHAPDARADVFSFGATLLAALRPEALRNANAFFLRFPREDFLAALGVAPGSLPAPFDRLLPRLLARTPRERPADAEEVLEVLRGRGGRPSTASLDLDPVPWLQPELDRWLAAVAATDNLEFHGQSAADREAVAFHAACALHGANRLERTATAVHVHRGGSSLAGFELTPPTSAQISTTLARLLNLEAAAARDLTDVLLADGARSAHDVSARLRRLAAAGWITPDGAGWSCPSASVGRKQVLADALRDGGEADERDTDPSTITALASRGNVARAEALARKAIAQRPAEERAIRAALARGLLRAGEPLRALPHTHDTPLLRARALLDAGNLNAAVALVANTTATSGETDVVNERERLLARIDWIRGDFDSGLTRLSGTEAADDLLRAVLLGAAGRGAVAKSTLERAVERIDENEQPYLLAATLIAQSDLLRRGGDRANAKIAVERALQIFRRLGNVHASASAALNLGVLAKDLGDGVEARDQLRRARTLFEHAGDASGTWTATANLGIALLQSGDVDAAIERLDEAIPRLQSLGAGGAAKISRAVRARALVMAGQAEAARAEIDALAAESDQRIQAELALARELLEKPREVPTMNLEPSDGSVSRSVFRTFLNVNRRLAAERDLDRAVQSLLEAAETVTGARASYLLVERAAGLRMEFASRLGSDDQRAFSRSLANKALSARRTMTAEDALGDRDLMNMPSVVDLRVRSALCAPFRATSGVAGALYVEHAGRSGAFGPNEAEMLEALADQAAIAVERMLREEAVDQEATEAARGDVAPRRRAPRGGSAPLLGKSPAMAELRKQIDRYAKSDLAVLVFGETGTGKELVARELHARSARASGPFVSENCSAIPPELMESELFGHTKGAFTGADADRAGLMELASGGTLFLDEVGDMPAPMQTKLLRALQERSIRRVGGRDLIPIDVRLVSATHRDLPALVTAGEFREDLYFRIAAGTIPVPALRERLGDVELLATQFLDRLVREHGRTVRIDDRGMALLRSAPWPGNVRELEHTIERSFLLSDGEVLDLTELPTARSTTSTAAADTPPRDRWPALPLNEAIYRTLHAALRATGGDKSAAAKLLQISRTALYEKLRREEVDRPAPGSFDER
ncbi:MAG: sigma 54-interacting transcriptional regulator [Planctomycetota bacterium]